MGPGDLTTLATVQAFIADGGTAPSDAGGVLSRLITTVSAAALGYMQRQPFASRLTSDRFNGKDNRAHFLDQWPVTSVVSLSIGGNTIPASPDGIQPGYVLDPWDGIPPGRQQSIQLIGGYVFPRGRLNCLVSYVAGYLVSGEAAVVASSAATAAQPYGTWIADGGISYASGAHLAKVPSAPALGQYALGTSPGAYVFNPADDAAAIVLAYSFVPSAVEEAVMEWVGERYKMRGRIGVKTQSLGGQTSESYDRAGVPDYIASQLQPYRKVLPV